MSSCKRNPGELFAELIRELEEKLPSVDTRDLELYPTLGAESFHKYLSSDWRSFFNEEKIEDWLPASLACSIRIKIRLLTEEASSRKSELAKLKEDTVASEAEIAKLKADMKILAKEKEDADAAYSNFSIYFVSVGQKEVLIVLRSEYPELDLVSLEAKFLPMKLGEEETEAVEPSS
ncbi:hypothetical protein Adt_03270 [Abeliophyllum distichum]|uniref:Uncharacterized protein n=1 Tax=Abeliophyllum distichum TaxID=126358 RepID=A0ABD1VY08_9LAMI